MPALFSFGAWQGTATRIPGTNKTLNEAQVGRALKTILPALSIGTATQVQRVMAGESNTLTQSARVEFSGMLDGYLQRSNP
jgi:hypothetical protein